MYPIGTGLDHIDLNEFNNSYHGAPIGNDLAYSVACPSHLLDKFGIDHDFTGTGVIPSCQQAELYQLTEILVGMMDARGEFPIAIVVLYGQILHRIHDLCTCILSSFHERKVTQIGQGIVRIGKGMVDINQSMSVVSHILVHDVAVLDEHHCHESQKKGRSSELYAE